VNASSYITISANHTAASRGLLTENKPPNSRLLTKWKVRVGYVHNKGGYKQNRSAGPGEGSKKHWNRPFIRQIARDLEVERIIRMVGDKVASDVLHY
jgi:hypothetical protein